MQHPSEQVPQQVRMQPWSARLVHSIPEGQGGPGDPGKGSKMTHFRGPFPGTYRPFRMQVPALAVLKRHVHVLVPVFGPSKRVPNRYQIMHAWSPPGTGAG